MELAKGYGIDALCVDHKAFETREAFEEKLYEVISQYSPDLIVLAGFMRILTAGFVDRFEGKILNIHPALLPSFKGLDTHQRAIDAGVRMAGTTVHFVTAALESSRRQPFPFCQAMMSIDWLTVCFGTSIRFTPVL